MLGVCRVHRFLAEGLEGLRCWFIRILMCAIFFGAVLRPFGPVVGLQWSRGCLEASRANRP